MALAACRGADDPGHDNPSGVDRRSRCSQWKPIRPASNLAHRLLGGVHCSGTASLRPKLRRLSRCRSRWQRPSRRRTAYQTRQPDTAASLGAFRRCAFLVVDARHGRSGGRPRDAGLSRPVRRRPLGADRYVRAHNAALAMRRDANPDIAVPAPALPRYAAPRPPTRAPPICGARSSMRLR